VFYKLSIKKFIFLLLAFNFAFFPVSHADESATPADESLEELKSLSVEELLEVPLVYGASKHEQKVSDAPSSVSIVTRDEIKKFGYRSLADILRGVRGFYLNYDRNYGYIGLRGFNRPGDFGGRILLLVDGHRVNDPLYDSAPPASDFILDVDLIDRVEIIRGPGSSLYGNNAFFGVINVITRTGQDLQGVELAGRAGSFDSYEGRASFGKRFENGLELLLSGSRFESDGRERLYYKEFDQPQNNHGIAENLDGDSNYRLFGSLAYGDFTLRGAFVSREKDVPTAAYGTQFNQRGFSTLDERYFVELAYAHQFANDLDVKARVYYDWYGYVGIYPYNYSGLPGGSITLNQDDDDVAWWGGELQVSKRLFEKHWLTAGLEYRDNYHVTHRNFDRSPVAEYGAFDSGSRVYSFYVQDEYALLPELTLNAGVRYDYFNFLGDTINPRVAAIYNPWEKTTFKLLYGQAFRSPNEGERSMVGAAYKPNPNLQPETIRSYEIIWEQLLPYNLKFSASGFINQIKGLISQSEDANGFITYANLSDVETKGFELELEGKTNSGWLGRVSYTGQHSEVGSSGSALSNSPPHLVKFNLLAPLYLDKLFAALEIQYSSSVKTLSGNTSDGYWLTNVNLFSQHLVPGLEVSGGVFNLFDHEYELPGAEEHLQDVIKQDGRTFQVTLRYRF
jgi:iron complex outermembrane receptor protein